MAIIKKSTNNKCWRGCEEKGALLHYWCDCKLVHPLWKAVWRVLRNLKTELPYDPAVLLMGIYLDKTVIQKDRCTHMFIEILFTITKTGKWPKCPLTHDLIKIKYIYTMAYHSAIKRNEIMPFAATWMQLEIIILSKSERERWTPYHLHVESEIWQMNLSTKMKQIHRRREQTSDCQGAGEGRIHREFGISGCKLLNTQWLDNKVLTVYREDIFREIYSVSWDNHNGKIQKKYLYMCNLVTLLCSRN